MSIFISNSNILFKFEFTNDEENGIKTKENVKRKMKSDGNLMVLRKKIMEKRKGIENVERRRRKGKSYIRK